MNFLPDSEILPSHSDLFAQRSCRSILTHDRHRGDQAESVDKLRCDFENVPLVGSKFLPNSTTLSSFRTSVSLAWLQFDPSTLCSHALCGFNFVKASDCHLCVRFVFSKTLVDQYPLLLEAHFLRLKFPAAKHAFALRYISRASTSFPPPVVQSST